MKTTIFIASVFPVIAIGFSVMASDSEAISPRVVRTLKPRLLQSFLLRNDEKRSSFAITRNEIYCRVGCLHPTHTKCKDIHYF